MNDLSPQEIERLFNGAVDRTLSEADEQALESILRINSAVRRQYLRFTQLHALLQWDQAANAAVLTTPTAPALPKRRARTPVSGYLYAAVIGILASALLGYVLVDWHYYHPVANPSAPIARVESVEGSVRFRADSHEQPLAAGTELAAGTLLLDGEAAAVQVRFLDGTLITLTGQAELSFADDRQKQLRLRQGMLTAEVQPQPTGAPLIVETPTARVEVLGTVFTLAAEPEQTRVSVDAGRVRVERLVDGRTQEVPAAQSWVASLDRTDMAQPARQTSPALGFRYSFTQPGSKSWKGKWLSADANHPGRVQAVPCVVGRRKDAKPLVHYGVTLRRTADFSLGVVPADGVLRMKYRCQQPAPLLILLSVHKPHGAFGGNFECKVESHQDNVGGDDWRTLEIPLSAFRSLVSNHPTLAPESRLNLLMVTTLEEDRGLEVAEVSITATETTP